MMHGSEKQTMCYKIPIFMRSFRLNLILAGTTWKPVHIPEACPGGNFGAVFFPLCDYLLFLIAQLKIYLSILLRGIFTILIKRLSEIDVVRLITVSIPYIYTCVKCKQS